MRTLNKIKRILRSTFEAVRSVVCVLYKWVLAPMYHLLRPRVCPMCGKVLAMQEEHLCPACIRELPRTEEGRHRDNHTEGMFADTKHFVRGAAYCFYVKGQPYQRAIQALKFDSQPELAAFLAEKAAEEWTDTAFFEGIDCLVPLPLHPKRLRERGYNQAEWIARGISKASGIPVDSKHLYRKKNNGHQSAKNLSERQQLDQIFGLKHPEELKGKHVLLIDDVVTSGTTLRRAMEVLDGVRGCRYSVFTLGVARD